jgi:hypothetical protein
VSIEELYTLYRLLVFYKLGMRAEAKERISHLTMDELMNIVRYLKQVPLVIEEIRDLLASINPKLLERI